MHEIYDQPYPHRPSLDSTVEEYQIEYDDEGLDDYDSPTAVSDSLLGNSTSSTDAAKSTGLIALLGMPSVHT